MFLEILAYFILMGIVYFFYGIYILFIYTLLGFAFICYAIYKGFEYIFCKIFKKTPKPFNFLGKEGRSKLTPNWIRTMQSNRPTMVKTTKNNSKKDDELFKWSRGKTKELTLDEVTDIEELLEDDDW